MLEKSSHSKHARYFEKIEKYISNVFEYSLKSTCKIVVYFHYICTESAKNKKKILWKPTELI